MHVNFTSNAWYLLVSCHLHYNRQFRTFLQGFSHYVCHECHILFKSFIVSDNTMYTIAWERVQDCLGTGQLSTCSFAVSHLNILAVLCQKI